MCRTWWQYRNSFKHYMNTKLYQNLAFFVPKTYLSFLSCYPSYFCRSFLSTLVPRLILDKLGRRDWRDAATSWRNLPLTFQAGLAATSWSFLLPAATMMLHTELLLAFWQCGQMGACLPYTWPLRGTRGLFFIIACLLPCAAAWLFLASARVRLKCSARLKDAHVFFLRHRFRIT